MAQAVGKGPLQHIVSVESLAQAGLAPGNGSWDAVGVSGSQRIYLVQSLLCDISGNHSTFQVWGGGWESGIYLL